MTKILISTFLLIFSLTNKVVITGHFKDTHKIKPISTARRQIILMTNKKIIAKTITDANGYYELNFLDIYSKADTLKFYYTADANRDTILLMSLTSLPSDTPTIDLFVGAGQ